MQQSSRPLDIGEIAALLAERIEPLCAHLLPAGVREGHEWRVGSVAGEAGRSMAVHLSGARAGVWKDFGGRPDDRGDGIDLVAQVLFGGDKRQATRWALDWLGVARADPASFKTTRRGIEEGKAKAKREEAWKRDHALGLFLAARAQLRGTPAEAYLKGRAIDFAALGRQPGALRYHPELMHPETGELVPALIAAITDGAGRTVAVHRTFLEIHADGRVTKLSGVKDAKLTLGRLAGGSIHLWRGSTGKPWRDAQAGEWLLIGEGIEDTATAVMHHPDLRAACAVSLANMGSLELPAAIEGVILLAQNDPELDTNGKPHPARVAIQRAIEHFQRAGKRIRLARPDPKIWPGIKDVNELAQRASA